MSKEVTFRFAERKDCALILDFIKKLADYEKLGDEVVANESLLEEWIFNKAKAEVIFAVVDGKEVGFALFFIIFQHSWEEREYIWKICSCLKNIVVTVTARRY